MARFYGRFDSGSGGWATTLDSDFFERFRIGADSASGARLRDGLIASRSALSTDAYADIPASYEDGQLGTIVPGDNYSSNGSTFVSWSRAGGAVFTSSTATSATWGVRIPADYRTRPTASILSTNTLIGGPTASVGVNYTTYTNATTAVRAVLDLVQNGAGTLRKVYDRLGNNPSRTLHSIWHDENLQYFAWDDFTPGQPTVNANSTYSPNTPSSSLGHIVISASREFINDWNTAASASVVATLVYATSSNGQFTGPNSTHKSLSTTIPYGNWTASSNAGMFTYRWDAGVIQKANGNLIDGQSSDGLQLNLSVTFLDAVINSSQGTAGTVTRNSGANITVNGVSIGSGGWIKIGSV